MKRNWKVSMQFLQQKFTNILNVENSSRFVICGDIDIYKSIIMVLTLSPSDTNRRWRLSHFQWTTSRPASQIVFLVHSIQVRFSTKCKYRLNIKKKLIVLLRDAFQVNDDSADVRKSVGIDKEGGLVFALDTMQVMLVGDYNPDDISL